MIENNDSVVESGKIFEKKFQSQFFYLKNL